LLATKKQVESYLNRPLKEIYKDDDLSQSIELTCSIFPITSQKHWLKVKYESFLATWIESNKTSWSFVVPVRLHINKAGNWVLDPCRIISWYMYLRGMYCLQYQDEWISKVDTLCTWTRKMETTCFSKTLMSNYNPIQCQN